MHHGCGRILIACVNDCLFFGPDVKEIDKAISELEAAGCALTREAGDKETEFSFLGVSVKPNKDAKMLTLTQGGLIDKVLAAVGVSSCNARGSPSAATPLGTDATAVHVGKRNGITRP
jgi:hypothetical protein